MSRRLHHNIVVMSICYSQNVCENTIARAGKQKVLPGYLPVPLAIVQKPIYKKRFWKCVYRSMTWTGRHLVWVIRLIEPRRVYYSIESNSPVLDLAMDAVVTALATTSMRPSLFPVGNTLYRVSGMSSPFSFHAFWAIRNTFKTRRSCRKSSPTLTITSSVPICIHRKSTAYGNVCFEQVRSSELMASQSPSYLIVAIVWCILWPTQSKADQNGRFFRL